MNTSFVYLIRSSDSFVFYGKYSSKGSGVACFTRRWDAEMCINRLQSWKEKHDAYPPIDALRFISPKATSRNGDLQLVRADLDHTQQSLGAYGLSVLLFGDDGGYITTTYDVPLLMKREILEHQFYLSDFKI
jgi:hypothetical protein